MFTGLKSEIKNIKTSSLWGRSIIMSLLLQNLIKHHPPSRLGLALPSLPNPNKALSSSTARFYTSQMTKATESSCPKFIPVQNGRETSCDGFKFRIVSYNILAQVYVKSSLFPHSPSPCLRWKARSKAILTVLKSLESDILCIQELDEYDAFYKQNIESYGYSSIYIQRSGQKRDGCGIFYKPNRADLVLEEKIEYNDLVDSLEEANNSSASENVDTSVNENNNHAVQSEGLQPKKGPSDCGDIDDPRVRFKRDCVGIMAAFRLKDASDHHLIVANTHLYWDPELADVKLAQAKYLLLRLAQFKATVSENFDCIPSVVLCGDFNSTPGDKVYDYIVSRNSETMPSQDKSQELPIPLCSTYAFVVGEPPFTNCTPDFTDTLDYIFFSPAGRLKPVSLLELPGLESSSVFGGLPNYHHPSDHLPIGTDFEVMDLKIDGLSKLLT